MTNTLWWLVVGGLSIIITALDVVTVPDIRLQVLFIVPVAVAAWYLGRRAGFLTAVVLVGCRFAIAVWLEQPAVPVGPAAVNEGIRLAVLIGVAALVATEHEKRRLTERVLVLEGILPTCMICQKVRGPDGTWDRLEAYASRHDDPPLGHGLCEECQRGKFGES